MLLRHALTRLAAIHAGAEPLSGRGCGGQECSAVARARHEERIAPPIDLAARLASIWAHIVPRPGIARAGWPTSTGGWRLLGVCPTTIRITTGGSFSTASASKAGPSIDSIDGPRRLPVTPTRRNWPKPSFATIPRVSWAGRAWLCAFTYWATSTSTSNSQHVPSVLLASRGHSQGPSPRDYPGDTVVLSDMAGTRKRLAEALELARHSHPRKRTPVSTLGCDKRSGIVLRLSC